MARALPSSSSKDAAYEMGIRITTTITSEDQAAYEALRKGVLDYDRRHGYRGPESFADMKEIRSDQDEALGRHPGRSGRPRRPAGRIGAQGRTEEGHRPSARHDHRNRRLGPSFAAPMLSERAPAGNRVRRRAIVRIRDTGKGWEILQLPEVRAALVATDPHTGAIKALVGGFDFDLSKVQPCHPGLAPAGLELQALHLFRRAGEGLQSGELGRRFAVELFGRVTGSQAWEPKNYDGRYEGPMTIRNALARSKNMVSIRLLEPSAPSTRRTMRTLRFRARAPPALPHHGAGGRLCDRLGNGERLLGLRQRRLLAEPHIVKGDGRWQWPGAGAGPTRRWRNESAARVIDPHNAFLMDSMLRDVVGAAPARARSLGRSDLAGKTGTMVNDYMSTPGSAVFAQPGGHQLGRFRQPQNLGHCNETGGAAALPIWIDFMRSALKGVPETRLDQPPGLIRIVTEDGDSNELMYLGEPAADSARRSSTPTPCLRPARTVQLRPRLLPVHAGPQAAPPAAPAPTRRHPRSWHTGAGHDLAPRPIKRNWTRVPATPVAGMQVRPPHPSCRGEAGAAVGAALTMPPTLAIRPSHRSIRRPACSLSTRASVAWRSTPSRVPNQRRPRDGSGIRRLCRNPYISRAAVCRLMTTCCRSSDRLSTPPACTSSSISSSKARAHARCAQVRPRPGR